MACLLFLVPSGCATFAVEFTGTVVEVMDGDTLIFVQDGGREHIRLYGIDCPELNQDYGEQARQATANWTLGETVTVKAWGVDMRYGHTIGMVILADGTNLNHKLVGAGLAWWDRRFEKETRLADLEAQARAARRGLWADADPIPPWEFRERSRSRASTLSGQSKRAFRLCGAKPDRAPRFPSLRLLGSESVFHDNRVNDFSAIHTTPSLA